MQDCTFCKIVKGDLSSHKVYEDKDHLAFLDIFPPTKGTTLVITKKHFTSNPFELPDDVYSKIFLAAKKVAKKIEKSLKAKRIFLVVEGMEIDHIHVKLYPFYKISRNTASESTDHVKIDEYRGYITTLHGPRAKDEELTDVAKAIRSVP